MASPKSGSRKPAASRLADRAKSAVKKKVNTYKKKRLVKKANKTATDL